MKDSEFIELLNLYLDHEISPADAARLEAEVLGNAARREVYREYCRIQKGCKLLAQEFQTEVPAVNNGKVVAFESPIAPAHRSGFWVAGGFAAAAACLALIFVVNDRRDEAAIGGAQETFARSTAPAAPAAFATERNIGRTVTVPEPRLGEPVLVNALTLAGNPVVNSNSLLTATEQPAPQFEWMHTMRLAPVQRVSIEEFRFDGRSPLRKDDRSYSGNALQQGPMEWNAIRFQR